MSYKEFKQEIKTRTARILQRTPSATHASEQKKKKIYQKKRSAVGSGNQKRVPKALWMNFGGRSGTYNDQAPG